MQGFTPQFIIEPEVAPDQNILGLMQGYFILDGETVFLQTRKGDRFNLDRVNIVTSAFNDADGVLRFPRPFIYDAKGNTTQQGDLLVVGFYRGDVSNPVVLGSIIPVNFNDFFHEFTQADYQKKKARFETAGAIIEYQDDGNGEIQLDITAQDEGAGNISINLTGSSDNGNLSVTINGNVQLTAQKDVTIESSQVINIEAADQVNVAGDSKVVIDSPAIELGEGATESLVKGDSWSALFVAHTHNVTGVGAPSGPPINAASASNCLSSRNKTL